MKIHGKLQLWVLSLLCAAGMAAPPAPAQFQGQFGGQQQTRSSSSTGQVNKSGLSADTIIQVDPDTGTLVIVTDPETHERIAQVLKTLDQPVPQVLIKVLFLEVTHTKDLDIGVDGTFSFDGKSPTNRDTITNAFGVLAETKGGFYHLLEKNLDATLRAMAETTKLEVLSRPSILTRNNVQAVITVGQTIPLITSSRITTNGDTINSVEYQDIGIILRVTPFITPDGLVEMDVQPQITTLTADTVPISNTVNYPVIAKRSAETRVVVPDGNTVVIGGLMEDSKTQNIKKVPLLGDIPILGYAFKRKTDGKSKTELLIFLTPHVVSRTGQLQAMSEKETDHTELAPKAFSQQQFRKFLGGPDETQESQQSETPSETPEK